MKKMRKKCMKNYERPASLRRDDSSGGGARERRRRRRGAGGGEWVAKVYYNIGDGVEGKCSAGAMLAPLL